jgi:hypothetical protein
MSKVEMKVGEWYESGNKSRWFCACEIPKLSENNYRFICYNSKGRPESYIENGFFIEDSPNDSLNLVRHLPGCTGFDWQEPKIPEGWRRLADDEILTRQDMYITARDGSLATVFSYDGRYVKDVLANWACKSSLPFACIRKIEEPKPEPKFKVGDVVYATKPKEIPGPPFTPVWPSDMDDCLGAELEVTYVSSDTTRPRVNAKRSLSGRPWCFHPDWLSKEPPAAQYRPFANDEEYAPHFDRPVKRAYKNNEHVPGAYRILAYGEGKVWTRHDYMTYEQMFHDGRKFADTNEPFGVKIS